MCVAVLVQDDDGEACDEEETLDDDSHATGQRSTATHATRSGTAHTPRKARYVFLQRGRGRRRGGSSRVEVKGRLQSGGFNVVLTSHVYVLCVVCAARWAC
jgi:hypothetical protein